jgi:tetratricopeptide (TPR) repeat protein
MDHPITSVIAGRYALADKLGEGGMGAVYRARDRLTGQSVAVKRLAIAAGMADTQARVEFAGTTVGDLRPLASDDRTRNARRPTESGPGPTRPAGAAGPLDSLGRLAIANEFRILASLRHPNIISVLDYGFDRDEPYLVLEVIEGAATITGAARGRAVKAKLELLAQLLRALHYLHRRGICHRDLKPSNVLVADGRVRVLDFGLALERGDDHRPAGTLGYIAPEVLRGAPATAAADLWSAGIIAFELLAERHPLPRADERGRVELRPPRLTLPPGELGVDATSAVTELVDRLLAVDPGDRPSSAAQALRILARLGIGSAVDEHETVSAALGRAPLVGRVADRATLAAAVDELGAGRGAALAVVGRAGSGKSRLLDDVATYALVRGCAVALGEAPDDADGPYQVWRAVLRRLIARVGVAAPVPWPFLAQVVPDVGELLGIGPLAVPPLDPQTLQAALHGAVEALVRAQPAPTVILLDDLDRAGPESAALVAVVARLASQAPVVVIATAAAEADVDLRRLGLTVRELPPLGRADVAAFAVAVLGPLGDRADLVDLLVAASGGQPRLLVESIRTLARSAGGLEQIVAGPVPRELVLAGVEAALAARFAELDPAIQTLLRHAAVIGPELELGLLTAVVPTVDLAVALDEAERAGLIEVGVGGWRFLHGQARAAVLGAMSAEERRAAHAAVAAVLSNGPPDPVALAFHFGQAELTDAEARWIAAAAQVLLSRASYPRALASFQRALALLDARGLTGAERDHAELELQLGLGTCALILDGLASPAMAAAYDRAQALVEAIGGAGGGPAFAALFGQSAVHLFRGQITVAHGLSERALRLAQDVGDVDLEIEGRFSLANAEFWLGALSAAERNVVRVVAMWSPGRAALHAERFGQVPRVTCQTAGAWGLWAAGRPDAALSRAEEALAIARACGHGFSEAIAVQIVAVTRALRRDVTATLACAEELLRFGAPYPSYRVTARLLLAWAQSNREHDPQYLEDMAGQWRSWQEMGAGLADTFYAGLMADAYLRFAQPAIALEVAAEARRRGDATGERVLLADLLRLEGEAHAALDRPRPARQAFADAIALAETQGAMSLALRAAVAWARLEHDRGDAVEARALVAPALERMGDGADTVDQREAGRLLVRLGAR